MDDITEFCIDYQIKNDKYNYSGNNCRTFMIELCKFLQIKYPDAFPLEDKWYGLRKNVTESGEAKRNPRIKQIAADKLDAKMAEDDLRQNDIKEKEIMDEDQLYEFLCDNNFCDNIQGYFMKNMAYKTLRNTLYCFVIVTKE